MVTAVRAFRLLIALPLLHLGYRTNRKVAKGGCATGQRQPTSMGNMLMSRERPNQTTPDLAQSSNVGNFDQEVIQRAAAVSPCYSVGWHSPTPPPPIGAAGGSVLLRPVLVLPLHCRRSRGLQLLLLLTAASWASCGRMGRPAKSRSRLGFFMRHGYRLDEGKPPAGEVHHRHRALDATLGAPNHPKSWRLPCNLLGTQGRPYPYLLETRLGCTGDSRTKQLPNSHSASPG